MCIYLKIVIGYICKYIHTFLQHNPRFGIINHLSLLIQCDLSLTDTPVLRVIGCDSAREMRGPASSVLRDHLDMRTILNYK